MMTSGRKAVRTGLLLAVCAATLAPAAFAQNTFGAAQSVELWGGPAAKGTGAAGSHYDSAVTVTAVLAPASGSVEFWAGGALKATVPFNLTPRGVFVIPAPAELDGAGAYQYHVTSSTAVMAFSETWNDTPGGRFGVSVPSFTTADFLSAGDEASGGGAEDSPDPTRSRTNVGVLCSPRSAAACQLEVGAYATGALLGAGTITAQPGAAAQAALSSLVEAASGQVGVSLRLRLLVGIGQPYAIKNDNRTSDGTVVPLSVARSAFSTAPVVTSFTVTPDTGCSPLAVTLAWATTGASKVSISGVTGDLPANGTTTINLLTSSDLVLTATSPTGATTNVPKHVTINPPTAAPTPSPATAQIIVGGTVTGIIPPAPSGTISAAFVSQESTGSSFSVSGTAWVYVAGSVPGTDVVRITATGPCGPVTADFTATVLAPGAPQILSFTSDPTVGCAPQNLVLSWQTMDSVGVTITNIPGTFSANGSIPVPTPLTTTTGFTLTALGANGKTSKQSLTVVVDAGPPAPVLNPTSTIQSVGNSVLTALTGVANPNDVGVVTIQNQSQGTFYYAGGGNFRYTAGPVAGATDIFRVYDHNGCGYNYAQFTAQTIP